MNPGSQPMISIGRERVKNETTTGERGGLGERLESDEV
jgi:hypothetical protein